MLELDILLQYYIKNFYFISSEKRKKDFQKMLSYHDQYLWNWIIQGKVPKNKNFQKIIDHIRKY